MDTNFEFEFDPCCVIISFDFSLSKLKKVYQYMQGHVL